MVTIPFDISGNMKVRMSTTERVCEGNRLQKDVGTWRHLFLAFDTSSGTFKYSLLASVQSDALKAGKSQSS